MAATPPELDPARVEAWTDGQVAPALRLSGVPGAVVVVVRHDRVILSKGYGVADMARALPLRAEATLLDIASIGKSMTALITSQLIDEGVLNLDEDVNHYLKSAQVTGPKVTLRMLLGHRGGFDADLTGLFVPLDGDTAMQPGELAGDCGRSVHPAGSRATTIRATASSAWCCATSLENRFPKCIVSGCSSRRVCRRRCRADLRMGMRAWRAAMW